MRGRPGSLLFVLLVSACQDAPITADQLEPNGRLRWGGDGIGHAQAFSAGIHAVIREAVQVSVVLAAEAEGALEDRSVFEADVGTIFLHVRADGLLAPRPVVYRWTHEGESVLVPGELAPSDAMSLGTHFDVGPDAAGRWTVEVLAGDLGPEAADDAGQQVLFRREFVVKRAET